MQLRIYLAKLHRHATEKKQLQNMADKQALILHKMTHENAYRTLTLKNNNMTKRLIFQIIWKYRKPIKVN